jgi:hypothetical protein
MCWELELPGLHGTRFGKQSADGVPKNHQLKSKSQIATEAHPEHKQQCPLTGDGPSSTWFSA